MKNEVAAAAEMIQASEKPFIFVGGGAILSGASKELKEFVREDGCTGYGFTDGKKEHFREPIQDIQECWECTERRHPIMESASATC